MNFQFRIWDSVFGIWNLKSRVWNSDFEIFIWELYVSSSTSSCQVLCFSNSESQVRRNSCRLKNPDPQRFMFSLRTYICCLGVVHGLHNSGLQTRCFPFLSLAAEQRLHRCSSPSRKKPARVERRWTEHTHTKKPRFVKVCVPHAGHNAKSILSLPLYCPFACARALNSTHALSLFTAQPKRQLLCTRTHARPHVRPCT